MSDPITAGHRRKAKAFFESGRLQEAEEQLRKALEASPSDADARCELAVVLGRTGRVAHAVSELREALKLDPSHCGCRYSLAVHLERMEAWAEAVAEYLAFVSHAPKTWERFVLLAKDRVIKLRQRMAEGKGAGQTMSIEGESSFRELLAQAEREAFRNEHAAAYQTALKARAVRGFERSSKVMDLQAKLGQKGVRSRLASAWQRHSLQGHEGYVSAVRVLPDCLRALSGGKDGAVRLWSLSEGRPFDPLEERGAGVSGLEVSSEASLAAVAGMDGLVRVFSLESRERLATMASPGGPAVCVALSADGTLVGFGTGDGGLEVREAQTGRRLSRLTPAGRVTAAAFTPDGALLLVGDGAGGLVLWDHARDAATRALRGHDGRVHEVCVSADGRRAVSAGDDGTVRCWILASGEPSAFQGRHAAAVRAVCLASNGRFAVSGGDDATVRVWNLGEGKELVRLEGHASKVRAVGISSDGRYAVSGGDDGRIIVWELDWEYAFPETAEWDEAVRPFVENFLALRTGKSGLPSHGAAQWTEEDFQRLVRSLGEAGLGWVDPAGVSRRLAQMSASAVRKPVEAVPQAPPVQRRPAVLEEAPVSWRKAAIGVVAFAFVLAGAVILERVSSVPGGGSGKKVIFESRPPAEQVRALPVSPGAPTVADGAMGGGRPPVSAATPPSPALPAGASAADSLSMLTQANTPKPTAKSGSVVEWVAIGSGTVTVGHDYVADWRAEIRRKRDEARQVSDPKVRMAQLLQFNMEESEGPQICVEKEGCFHDGVAAPSEMHRCRAGAAGYEIRKHCWNCPSDSPARVVNIQPFEMSRTEVTFGQYDQCVAARACQAIDYESCVDYDFVSPDRPVVCVTWKQAQDFARWVGGRLPSEMEWEFAARSGGRRWAYPWGNDIAHCGRAVMNDRGYGCGTNMTLPACSRPAGNTAQGLCDMAGNASEWLQDRYFATYAGAPKDGAPWERFQCPLPAVCCPKMDHESRLVRGGNWYSKGDGLTATGRASNRPDYRSHTIGFRVARSAGKP